MFFQNSVIKKYLAALNAEQVTAAWEVYKAYFLNKEIQDNIRSSKEEQFQEGFLRELFVKVFGYTLNPSPNFNLITEQKNETDAKKADGAILRDDKVPSAIRASTRTRAMLSSPTSRNCVSISLYGLPIPQHVPKWNDFQTVMHQSEIQLTSQIA